MEQCNIYLWPIINGKEYEVTYKIQLVDSWKDSWDEPAGEIWEMILDSEEIDTTGDNTTLWVPDGYIEKICEDHFAIEQPRG